MFKKSRWSMLTAALILALLFSAFPLGAVMAEGEEPPLPETPQAEEQLPPEEVSSVVEETPAETLTVEEVVAQVPDEVVVVPLDLNGEALPLVEETTASALVSGDPIYCPGSAIWGDVTCTAALPTIEDAISAAALSGSGTIYVAVDYTDLTPAPVVIDGAAWPDAPSWLNLIGGVDFSTGEVTGKTVLNRPVVVSNLLSFWMENFVISGVQGTALTIGQTEDAYVFNSELSGNAGAGLDIEVSGDAILGDIKADENGATNEVDAAFVSLTRVSSSGNPNGSGMVVNSTGDVYVESSKFNSNGSTGLLAAAGSNLFVLCSQALNNVSAVPTTPTIFAVLPGDADGMNLSSANDMMLLCNKMKGNSGYGLNATAGGTIYMGSNTISGNGILDQLQLVSPNPVEEQYAPCTYLCPSCKGGGSDGEEEKPQEGKTQVVIVNVDDPSGSVEFKGGYATVFKLMEEKDGKEKEIQRTILMSGSAPDGSTGVYTPLDESELPAPLGEGITFMPYGFNLAITNPGWQPAGCAHRIYGHPLLPSGRVRPARRNAPGDPVLRPSHFQLDTDVHRGGGRDGFHLRQQTRYVCADHGSDQVKESNIKINPEG